MSTLSKLQGSRTIIPLPHLAHEKEEREAIQQRRNPKLIISLALFTLLVFTCVFARWIAPLSYETQQLNLSASPPSLQHWFGTDVLGRDLLSRVLFGGQVSLLVGFLATSVSLVIGVLWGGIAGYFGGRIDSIMMRIVDVLYSLPFMIFVILLMVVFGRNFFLLFLAIGAVEWLTMARIVRAQVHALKKQEFIESLRVMGFHPGRILFYHLLPNCMGPVIVYTTLTIPNVMLLEAFLSFLGLGIQPPMSSWGSLIAAGVESMEEHPWLFLFPGITLSATLFLLNFLGDTLRDFFDPKTKGLSS